MGEAKPWQIGVVVLGLLVLVGSIVYQCQSRPKYEFAETVTFVDVTTGELWVSPYRTDRSSMFPTKNPKTGTLTLFPVAPEAGGWVIRGRYLEAIAQAKLANEKVVNLRDGTVNSVGEPVKFDMYAR